MCESASLARGDCLILLCSVTQRRIGTGRYARDGLCNTLYRVAYSRRRKTVANRPTSMCASANRR